MSQLVDTNASQIAAEFVRERRRAGSPTMGMVMTLVIVMTEEDAEESLRAARLASHEHPGRVLAVIIGSGRGRGRIVADVEVGVRAWTGEIAQIRLSGEVTKHAASVVLPLLLPDSPVVVWWPGRAPADPARDPIGQLGQRRITDAAALPRGQKKALLEQCANYAPGTTDLAWTRVTPWRALLAASLDQHHVKVTSAVVAAERVSPSADLLSAWLAEALNISVTREVSDGPGITEVTLNSKEGPISISRYDGLLGTLSTPGQPDRPVALKRRSLPELLAEEMRHLDEDDVYAAVTRYLVRNDGKTEKPAKKAPAKRSDAKKAPAKKSAAKKSAPRKASR